MAKILMIATCYPTPTVPDTEICHYFTREWVKMGHEVIVFRLMSSFPAVYYSVAKAIPSLAKKISRGSDIQSQTTEMEEYILEGVKVYSVPVKKYIPHGSFSTYTLRSLSKQLLNYLQRNNFTPDAIAGHWANPSLYVISKLKESFPLAKTSLTLHGETYHTIAKVFKDCDSLLKQIDYIGYRSPRIKKEFLDSCPFGKKGFYCYSGVSSEFLDNPPVVTGKYSSAPLESFVYIGRLIEYKYPRAVIEALEGVYGNNAYHLSYVGKKSDMYDSLNEYVIANKLNDRVSFHGLLPRNQIPALLDSSQCLIMISKGEVFGMVYIEAMARGCIVVAGSDSGVLEIIKHGENGFLCEPGNVEQLKSIIAYINGLSKEEKELIGMNARKTAENLSDSRVAYNYINTLLQQ